MGWWLPRRKAFIPVVAIAGRFVLFFFALNRIFLSFGTFLSKFDRVVINDTAVDGLATSIRCVAYRARYIQSGQMYSYGLAMAVGAIVFIYIWWFIEG